MKKFICWLFGIKNIYNGNLFFKMEKYSPYYGTGSRKGRPRGSNECRWALKLPFEWGWLSIREDSITGLSDWAKNKCYKIFGTDIDFDGCKVYNRNQTWYIDTIRWIFNGDEWYATDNWRVFRNNTDGKYYGYSHRGMCGFGIGDTFFTGEEIDQKTINEVYYSNPKYRKRFIKTLQKYHKTNEVWGFKDVVEGGIMCIVPFVEKGTKKIETRVEAFLSALNFADYVS